MRRRRRSNAKHELIWRMAEWHQWKDGDDSESATCLHCSRVVESGENRKTRTVFGRVDVLCIPCWVAAKPK